MAAAYTLARWLIRDGQENEFVRRWKDELGPFLRDIAPETHGTLILSVENPRLFYSFGPSRDLDQIAEMRAHPRTPDVMGRVIELCDEATPGAYELVMDLP